MKKRETGKEGKKLKTISKRGLKKEAITGRKNAGNANEPLRVLILEDSAADAELMERQLRREKTAYTLRRAETRAGFLKGLKEFKPDLILADYTLPGFNAIRALAMARKHDPLLPFIVVTGSIGEEKAVDCLRAGADDYLLKDRLERLGQAVHSALKNRCLQAEKNELQVTLQRATDDWLSTFDAMNDAVCLLDAKGAVRRCNKAMNRLLELPFQRIIGRQCLELLCGEKRRSLCAFQRAQKDRQRHQEETLWRGRWYQVAVDPILDAKGRLAGAVHVMTDISERKRAEEDLLRSEERFRALYFGNPIAAHIWQRQGDSFVLNEINSSSERICGSQTRKLIGSEAGVLYRKRPEVMEAFRESFFDKRVVTLETVSEHFLPGRLLSLTFAYVPPDLVTVYFEDITERRRAEIALRESEARFSGIFHSSPMPIAISRLRDNRLIDVNAAWQAATGYTRKESVGHTPLELNMWVDPAARKRLLAELRGHGGIREREFRLRRKSGDISDMLLSAERISLAGEDFMLSIAVDISERKHAEEALHTSKAQLAAAMEIAKLGHWELDVASGTFTFSDEFYAIFHTTAAEMGGYQMPIAEYSRRFVHPEDAPQIESETRKALETDDPHFTRTVEHRILYADGGEGHISVRYFVVKDAQGKTIKTYGVNQDISERKQTEKALLESEQRYRQLVDMSPDAIAVHAGGKIAFLNPAALRLCGAKDAEELLGKPALNMVHPDSRAAAAARIQRSLKQGSAAPPFNEKFVRVDGSVVDVEVCAVPIAFKGQPAMQVIIRDISERLRAEQALRESEERFRDLFECAAIGIYRTTPEGRIQMANPALLRMLGFSSLAELQERNLETAGFALESPRQRFTNEIIRLGSLSGVEAVWSRKDGTTVFVRESAVALRDESGAIICYQGAVEDISQRKRAEDSLREMNEIFHQFLRYNPIYVFIKDESIRPVFLSDNYERMLGRPLSEIIGKTMDELFPSALSRQMIEDDKGILRDGVVREFQEELHGRIYSTIKFPIIIDGRAKYLAGYTMDITERTRAEEALKLRNEELQRFNRASNGRELRMVELKRKINDLSRRLGQPAPYPLEFLNQNGTEHPIMPESEENKK